MGSYVSSTERKRNLPTRPKVERCSAVLAADSKLLALVSIQYAPDDFAASSLCTFYTSSCLLIGIARSTSV